MSPYGNWRRRALDSRGMTLIEILVVCAIVAILAAIALPMFISQKSDAQDAEAKASVRNARVAMETFRTDRETYEATSAQLISIEPALGEARDLEVSATADTYRVSVKSVSGAKGGGTFTVIRAADGRITRTCTNPGRGGCRSIPDDSGNLW